MKMMPGLILELPDSQVVATIVPFLTHFLMSEYFSNAFAESNQSPSPAAIF